MNTSGILLVNLGSPSAPTPAAVRRYLAQFLSDPRVVALPRLLWLPILHGIILRTRPAKSAAKYAEVWTEEGSPLAVHTLRQSKLLKGLLGSGGRPVEHAMRYGEPTIASALGRLAERGCSSVKVLPLYPQYSESTTASVRDALLAAVASMRGAAPSLSMVEDFHDHPGFIGALAATVRRHRERQGRGEKLVMSFHGLPQRAVDLGDPYQKQCQVTATLLAEELGLARDEYVVCYQSRFGAARWLQPYTEPTLVALAAAGVGEVDVVFPGFPSDCLETLEEIGIGAKAAFLGAGGKTFNCIPCLNESPEWIAALPRIVDEKARPLR